MVVLIDGKKVAQKILEPVNKEIIKLKQKGIVPTLAIILVGEGDRETLIYIREKKKKAKEIGIKIKLFRLDKQTKANEIKNLIKRLNQEAKVHAILLQLPLPAHLDPEEILNAIEPQKEVDGLTLKSRYPPACAAGIMKIFSFYKMPIKNKKVVILGAGRIVGKPLYPLLKKAGAKITLCSYRTSNIPLLTKKADILIGAMPASNFINKEMVKKGAVVIDAAKNVKQEVKKVASYLTPKIGGVGPVTVAMLLKNVVKATKDCNS